MPQPHRFRGLRIPSLAIRRIPFRVVCLVAFAGTPASSCLASSGAQTPAQVAGQPQVAPTAAPSAPIDPLEAGDLLAYHHRYQEAIAKYVSVPQKTAETWNKLGIAYQMMFNLNDAEHCYKLSIKLDPRDPNVYNNLGTAYESQLDHYDAEKMYHKAIQINPNFALAYKNLATSYMARHKYKQGRAADAQALAIDPGIFAAGDYLRVDNPASAHERGAMNYYMAVDCARAGQTACALDHLRMALNQGYISPAKIAADSNFAALASDPGFQSLLAEQSIK
jgi:tetratricopeptide (TPR) repeat protein